MLAPPVEEPRPLRNTEVQSPLPLPLPNILVGGRLAHFALCPKLGKDYRRRMGPFLNKKRLQNSVPRTSNSVTRPSLLPAASKSAAGRRSRQYPLKGGSGGDNSGMSWILLQNFPRSQEERQTQAYHRPLCAQSFCLHTDIQNGDTEKNERRHSVKRLGIFIGSDGCLFACPNTLSVSQIPQIHAERSSVPVKGTPIRPLDKSFRVYSLMTVIATFLRRRAITLHPYLNDWLARNQNHRRLLEHRQFILSLINSLGLIINYEKSDLVPAQVFTFIGMEFLTHINIVRVPQTRQMKILETVRMFSQKTSVSARDFLSLLGQLNAAADLVMLGRLHLRPLQMFLRNQWKLQKLPYCHQISMTTEILQHLKWWLQEDRYHQGIPLRIDPPSHTIFTDASLSGWGAHVEPEGLLFHGEWTEDQSRLHINVLEMKAIFLSLSRAVHKVKNFTVLVSTDNTTVVAYIGRQGGTHSTVLSEEVWNVLSLCLAHNIQLLAKHIPGRFNTLADRMSRIDKEISTEWSLNQEIANKIFQIMDFPSIDLFATRLNHRLPLYVSPIPDQKALSIDALTMDWNCIHAYVFPPFHLIPAVINKIRLSQCKIVLIAPLWPDRPRFPELLGLLVSPPVSLPVIPNLLAQLKGRILHQNPGHLQLHAWELSKNLCKIDNFQAMLGSMSPKLEETRLLKSKMQNGKSSMIGQINERLILSRPLPR